MQFDYFYGNEAEQFTFYRIPKILITSPHFKKISDSAKLLYGLMLDRMSLSIRNGWLDDDNRAYIFFTTNDVMEQMCCGTEKATKMLTELDSEKGIGLIERVKQGQGKPAIIYLKKFYELEDTARSTKLSEIESQDFQESKVKTFENRNVIIIILIILILIILILIISILSIKIIIIYRIVIPKLKKNGLIDIQKQ